MFWKQNILEVNHEFWHIYVWEREREREKENNKIKIENCNEILFLYINTYKVKVYSMLNSIIDDVIFVCRICASISFSEDETL